MEVSQPRLAATHPLPPYLDVMDMIPVDMLLPPKGAAHGNKAGVRAFTGAHDELTAYIVGRLTEVNLENLDDALDLLLEDPHYQQQRHDLADQIPWELVTAGLLDKGYQPIDEPHIPTVVAERVAIARKLETAVFRGVARYVVGGHGDTGRIPVVRTSKPVHPAMNFDMSLPLQMRTSLLNHKLGEPCGIALMSERITSSALADALVDRWLHGLRGLVGMLAEMNLVDASNLDLPEQYRVDGAAMFAAEREQQVGFVAALAEVERHGRGYPQVYLPDEDGDDE